jgi:catechol 2,3-dioxygenase-like lactoylglutathione lyase family enzyme
MSLRHTGITVTDIDESIEFYRDILGFEIIRIMDESGEHIDNFSALSNVEVTTVKMRDKSGGMLELLKYKSHQRQAEIDDITRIGCSHIALTINNLDLLLDKLDKKGYIINCKPQFSPDGNVKLTFCRGPDGVLLELVEELR